jgi:hypothetical protein
MESLIVNLCYNKIQSLVKKNDFKLEVFLMTNPKNLSDVINESKRHIFNNYIDLGIKRQPDTKPRNETQRLRMIVHEADIIKSKMDLSRFKPAPKEVVRAYANNQHS